VAQRLQVPVITTEQYPRGLGTTEPGLRALLPDAGLREKIHFSATAGAGLFDLPGGERRQFIVCGTETHVCVLQTVLGLLAAGREVFVVDERSEEHTSELQSRENLVCRLLLEKKNNR